MSSRQKIAIIGAGIAGLACARRLSDAGLNLVVFDKGRKAGGRTATRCVAGGIQFDHGAGIVRVNWLEPPSDDT
jgi:renalase